MIFDFHARRHPALLATLDAAGIGRAAVSAGGLISLDRLSVQINDGGRAEVCAANDDVYEQCARSGGRLLPFYFADPVRDVAAYRKRALDFRGLEISPAVHGFRLDDPAVHDLLGVAEENGHPVYVVTTARQGARPADLARLARDHPGATVVWGHCGHTGLEFAGLTEIAPVPTVLAEISGCLTVTARAAVDRLGASRVLFGTEFPLQDPRVELAKVAALGLNRADRHAVLGANALRILNEDRIFNEEM
jgi:predicted TIM-barrel fold metal-dependent hydrolase